MTSRQNPAIALLCLGLVIVIVAAVTVVPGLSTGSHQGTHTAGGTGSNEYNQADMIAAATTNPGAITANVSGPVPNTVGGTPYLAFDPIPDKSTGDLIVLSGTTNLPSGSAVNLKEINDSTGKSAMMANTIACPDARGDNRWRVVYDSTDWMRPGRYHYLVSTPKGDVSSSVQFTITGTFLGPESIRYYQAGSRTATLRGTGTYPSITVDPIGDRHKGDIFRISGTTNLVEGTMLQCTVWPVYYEDRSKRPAAISKDPCDGQFNIAGSPVAVVKGTGDTNRWSFPADMTIFPEKTGMLVHVSTTNEDFTAREIYGNATFNLI